MEKSKKFETLAAINIAVLLLFFYFRKTAFVKSSIVITLLCLLFPLVLFWIDKVWNKVFSLIGSVNAKLLLSVVYFLFLVPLAFLYRISRKQKKHALTDNYTKRDHLFTPEDFKRLG